MKPVTLKWMRAVGFVEVAGSGGLSYRLGEELRCSQRTCDRWDDASWWFGVEYPQIAMVPGMVPTGTEEEVARLAALFGYRLALTNDDGVACPERSDYPGFARWYKFFLAEVDRLTGELPDDYDADGVFEEHYLMGRTPEVAAREATRGSPHLKGE